MVLKNYWRWLTAMQKIPFYDGSAVTYETIGVVDITGATPSIMTKTNNNASMMPPCAQNRVLTNCSLRLGNGTNTYSGDEYTLANDITSNFSNLQYSVGFEASDSAKRILTITGTNNTANDITITELGVVKTLYRDANTSYQVLMAIVVLSSAVTVLAGDSFTIVAEWVEQ